MFADADVFWKWPSVYDAISVIGFALALISIWLALYLAKKQLRADFKKAADEAVERVAQMVLGNELSEATRLLREADRDLAEKEWARGIMRLHDVMSALARLVSNPKMGSMHQDVLLAGIESVRVLFVKAREHSRSASNRAHLPLRELDPIAFLSIELEKLRGKIVIGSTTINTEGNAHG